MAPIVIPRGHRWWVSFACLISLSFLFFFGFETLGLCYVLVWCEDKRRKEKVIGFVVVCELFGFL